MFSFSCYHLSTINSILYSLNVLIFVFVVLQTQLKIWFFPVVSTVFKLNFKLGNCSAISLLSTFEFELKVRHQANLFLFLLCLVWVIIGHYPSIHVIKTHQQDEKETFLHYRPKKEKNLSSKNTKILQVLIFSHSS